VVDQPPGLLKAVDGDNVDVWQIVIRVLPAVFVGDRV